MPVPAPVPVPVETVPPIYSMPSPTPAPREEQAAASAEARALAQQHCTLPSQLREECIFDYSLERYPFPSLIAQALGEDVEGEGALHELHHTVAARQWLDGVLRNECRAYAMRRNCFDGRMKRANPFRTGGELMATYQQFIAEVVAPLIEADGGGSGTLYYQRDPNFRCHLPGTGHVLVHKHCDADYFHQPNEVNIWVPLSEGVHGSNTLWLESVPGRGDFRPMELRPGQALRFWAHSCEHYTVPNTTEATRVSFDFRVVPSAEAFYSESYPNARRKDGHMRFGKAAYFTSARPSGHSTGADLVAEDDTAIGTAHLDLPAVLPLTVGTSGQQSSRTPAVWLDGDLSHHPRDAHVRAPPCRT